jgi:hypothetical protein
MHPRTLVLFVATSAALASPSRSQTGVTVYDWGDVSSSQLGQAVAGIGDLDGDGLADVAIGAPHGQGLQPDSGYVFLMSGKTGALLRVLNGEASGDLFGWDVDGVADLDGDGVEDVIVGAPRHEGTTTDSGAVYVLSGATGALIKKQIGGETDGQFGISVCRMSDVDLDGVEDYAIGELNDNALFAADVGSVRLMSGATHGTLRIFFGENTGDGFGSAIVSSGPIRPGVHHSIAIGAPGYDIGTLLIGVGKGYVYDALDGSLEFTRTGSTSLGAFLGASVAAIPDADGDLWHEVAFGEPGTDLNGTNSGRVVVHELVGGTLVREFHGAAGDQLGRSVAGLPDADGDGKADILIGAPFADFSTLVDCGIARSYSMATGGVIDIVQPAYSNQNQGWSVAGAKLNADNKTDLVAGTPFYDGQINGNTVPDSGWVRVVLSGTPLPDIYCTAKTNSAGCSPLIGSYGAASVSIGNNFTFVAANVLENMNGMLIWSLTPAAIPFGGGTLCLGSPVQRTPVQMAQTAAPGSYPCLGLYTYTFTQAYMAQHGFAPGDDLYAQFWSRDTGFAAPQNIGLTAAMHAVILP